MIDVFTLARAQVGAVVAPIVAPGIKAVFAASPGGILPFFLLRQAVSHAIARRAPHGELFRIIERNVCDWPIFPPGRRFFRRPAFGRRIAGLLNKVGILGISNFGAVHEEWLNGK